jgi:Co/Zn/Cd efflux system component
MALAWRARAALLKGATLAILGVYVLAAALWSVWHGGTPQAGIMGVVGLIARVANAGVALTRQRRRHDGHLGDGRTRMTMICVDASPHVSRSATSYGR